MQQVSFLVLFLCLHLTANFLQIKGVLFLFFCFNKGSVAMRSSPQIVCRTLTEYLLNGVLAEFWRENRKNTFVYFKTSECVLPFFI